MNIYIREVNSQKVKTIVLEPDRAARALKVFNRFSPHEAVNEQGVTLNLS